jgi:hypothetical protein
MLDLAAVAVQKGGNAAAELRGRIFHSADVKKGIPSGKV